MSAFCLKLNLKNYGEFMIYQKTNIIQFLIEFNRIVGIEPDSIFTNKRLIHIVKPRHIAFYILRENNVPFRLISESVEFLGGCFYDHSTIYHGHQKITDEIRIYKNDFKFLIDAGNDLFNLLVKSK